MMVKKEKEQADAEKIRVASYYTEVCRRMAAWAVFTTHL